MAYEEENDPDDDIAEENELSEQDDIIADEEREIKKIIEEGEKAAKEVEAKEDLEPEDSEPVKAPENSAPESRNKGLWKWFLSGIAIMLIIGFAFVFFRHTDMLDTTKLQHTGALAAYDPSEYFEGWKLDNKYLTFADLPLEKQKELFSANLTDIATWEFSKGDDTIYVWVRQFTDEDAAEAGANVFAPIAWHIDEQSVLSFGDDGRIGIYKITGQDPLTSFVRQNSTILSIAYYNKDNQIYDSATMIEDKTFLISLTKKIMTKIVSLQGQELKVANIKV